MPGTGLLLLLLSSVLLDVTVRAERRGGKQGKRNVSEVAFPGPRSFRGEPDVIPVKSLKSFSLLNGTQAPYASLPSPHAPPALQLLSNSTAGYLRGALSTQLIPGVYILIIAVGIPANVATLCAVVTKLRKAPSGIFNCSLALSDLLLLLSLIFRSQYHLHGNNWVLGETACRMVTACFYGNLYCSAQMLASISVSRYLSVVHPFLFKSLKTGFPVRAGLVSWGVFCAAALPELLVQQTYRIKQLDITTCHDVLPLDYSSHAPLLYYNLVLSLLGLLVPLVVTTACYAHIIYELSHSDFNWAKYLKASSLVFVAFLLCFVPAGLLHFLHCVHRFVDGEERFYIYFNMTVCLSCLHSCLDPFLFYLTAKAINSKLYRMIFKSRPQS